MKLDVQVIHCRKIEGENRTEDSLQTKMLACHLGEEKRLGRKSLRVWCRFEMLLARQHGVQAKVACWRMVPGEEWPVPGVPTGPRHYAAHYIPCSSFSLEERIEWCSLVITRYNGESPQQMHRKKSNQKISFEGFS